MADFSSSNVGTHKLHVIKDRGDTVIGYYMIIGWGLMVQVGLTVYFKRRVLYWDNAILPITNMHYNVYLVCITLCRAYNFVKP